MDKKFEWNQLNIIFIILNFEKLVDIAISNLYFSPYFYIYKKK